MAKRRRIPERVVVAATVRCGKGRHRVELEATAWGQVTAFNPCDLLPPAARQLSNSSCAPLVAEQVVAVEACLQTIWHSQTLAVPSPILPLPAWDKLAAFINAVREQKELLAEQLLEPAGGDEPEADARRWARFVLAERAPQAAHELLADCRNWSPSLQLAALCGAEWGDDSSALLLLEHGVQNPRILPLFRARLAHRLGQVGDEQHAAVLVDAVCSDQARLQTAAQKALDRLCERFCVGRQAGERQHLAPFRLALKCAYEHFQGGEQRITVWLADWARPHAEWLADAVIAGDPPSRAFAAMLLEQLADVRAAPALARAACDPHPEVAQAATRGLVVLGPALVQAGEASLPSLTDALRSPTEPPTLFALDALRKIGSPRAVDAVLNVLQAAGASAVRLAALSTLERVGDQRAVEPLLQELAADGDPSRAAARALAAVLDRLTIDSSSLPLLRRTLLSGHPQLASAALRRLTEPGLPDAVTVVTGALPGLNDSLQVQALMALRELDHSQALGPILEMLGHPTDALEASVRDHAELTAASLLKRLTGVSGAGLVVLVKALECPSVPVARAAARVLATCSDARLAAPLAKACLRGDGPLALAAGEGLKRLAGAEHLAWLARLLWHGDNCMARGAETALVAVGSRAVEPLLPAVNWPFQRARLAAVRALGRIGDARAIPVLHAASRDPDLRVRETAVAALSAIHAPRA